MKGSPTKSSLRTLPFAGPLEYETIILRVNPLLLLGPNIETQPRPCERARRRARGCRSAWPWAWARCSGAPSSPRREKRRRETARDGESERSGGCWKRILRATWWAGSHPVQLSFLGFAGFVSHALSFLGFRR